MFIAKHHKLSKIQASWLKLKSQKYQISSAPEAFSSYIVFWSTEQWSEIMGLSKILGYM